MNAMTRAGIASAMTVLMVGCATTEKALQDRGLQPLSGAELRSIYGKPRVGTFTSAQNFQNEFRIHGDGTYTASWYGGSDKGRYRIDGDLYCTTISVINAGREVCSRVYKVSANELVTFTSDGEYRGRATFSD